jgi:peptidylprolyl isomerase
VSGYIFESNNTGPFRNDTWTPFNDFVNQTSAVSTVTKTLNSTVDDTLSWAFWCNDTKNRWTGTPLQSDLIVSKVLLDTSMGNIVIQPFDDMPITSGNFLNLTETGVYDNTNFSRIAYDASTGAPFVIQGGDATVKGITVPTIQDELPNKHSNVLGTVAMAKLSDSSGNVIANSASDQFYINLGNNSADLDSEYSVFGTVISGMNVVDAISQLIPSGANATSYDGPPSMPVWITAQFVS